MNQVKFLEYEFLKQINKIKEDRGHEDKLMKLEKDLFNINETLKKMTNIVLN